MCQIKHIMTTFGVLVMTSSLLVSSCFIRNCPRGGKRSLEATNHAQRQCMACGAGGQCVGPATCCSATGCVMGGPEAAVCRQEAMRSTPCRVLGEPCGHKDEGNCVADGICCDYDSCTLNKKCRLPELEVAEDSLDEAMPSSREDLMTSRGDLMTSRMDLLALLQSLLRAKEDE